MRKLIIRFQLCLMIRLGRMHHPGTNIPMFQISFTTWETFCGAILSDDLNTPIWSTIARAHCVIGGVDINLSYL